MIKKAQNENIKNNPEPDRGHVLTRLKFPDNEKTNNNEKFMRNDTINSETKKGQPLNTNDTNRETFLNKHKPIQKFQPQQQNQNIQRKKYNYNNNNNFKQDYEPETERKFNRFKNNNNNFEREQKFSNSKGFDAEKERKFGNNNNQYNKREHGGEFYERNFNKNRQQDRDKFKNNINNEHEYLVENERKTNNYEKQNLFHQDQRNDYNRYQQRADELNKKSYKQPQQRPQSMPQNNEKLQKQYSNENVKRNMGSFIEGSEYNHAVDDDNDIIDLTKTLSFSNSKYKKDSQENKYNQEQSLRQNNINQQQAKLQQYQQQPKQNIKNYQNINEQKSHQNYQQQEQQNQNRYQENQEITNNNNDERFRINAASNIKTQKFLNQNLASDETNYQIQQNRIQNQNIFNMRPIVNNSQNTNMNFQNQFQEYMSSKFYLLVFCIKST